MPLINCPDCGKEISSEARSCVHCGYQKQQSMFTQKLGFDGEVFLIMIILGMFGVFAGFVAISQTSPLGIGIIIFGFSLMFFGMLFLLIRSLR